MQRFADLALMLSLLVSGSFVGASSATLDGLAVEVANQSEPVLCAEKDNVTLAFTSEAVKSFHIEAVQPAYLTSGLGENWEADWTACDMSSDPVHAATAAPRRITLYEDRDLRVLGYSYGTLWRPEMATVHVAKGVERGLHLLQVWLTGSGHEEEVLAFYPQDGYWRLRPLTPPGLTLGSIAYGSSFLVGPVEAESRPFVRIKDVSFEPKTRTFTLTFERGGSATVKLADVNTHLNGVDVAFDHPIRDRPFAMLRSMYVTEFNNDVARIAAREKGATGWLEEPIMKFRNALATDVWAGRLSPSRHNGTSPDLVFNGFSEGPVPKRPKNEPPPATNP